MCDQSAINQHENNMDKQIYHYPAPLPFVQIDYADIGPIGRLWKIVDFNFYYLIHIDHGEVLA